MRNRYRYAWLAGWLVWTVSTPVAAQEGSGESTVVVPEDDPYAPITLPHDVTSHEAHTEGSPLVPAEEPSLAAQPARSTASPTSSVAGRWELFWQSSFLWRDPVIVAVVSAVLLGLVGIYVVLRRIVFVTASLANVSGLGVAFGVLLGLDPHAQEAHPGPHPWYSDIIGLFGFSLLCTAAMAALFAYWRESKRISRESALGVTYVVSSALLVLVVSQLNQATHAIDQIIFGSAVAVEESQLVIVPLFALLLTAVHVWLRKDFLFVSFDPTAAQTVRYPVRALDMTLFVTIGLAIAITTRAIGALPVFAFAVLPPLCALLLTDRLRWAFVLASAVGALAALLGYAGAFMLALPVGPTMTATCAVLLAMAAMVAWLRRLLN